MPALTKRSLYRMDTYWVNSTDRRDSFVLNAQGILEHMHLFIEQRAEASVEAALKCHPPVFAGMIIPESLAEVGPCRQTAVLEGRITNQLEIDW